LTVPPPPLSPLHEHNNQTYTEVYYTKLEFNIGDRIGAERDGTLLVLFGKHNLCAKNTIHKTVVLVLKKCVKQK
jgi:hypothetical protein